MANKKKPLPQRSFYQNVEYFFDKAAAHTKYPKGLLEQIKACNSVYKISLQVFCRAGNGGVCVLRFFAYRKITDKHYDNTQTDNYRCKH